MSELINVAFKNLNQQKARTFLTLLGIIIGIAAIVALVSVGDGMKAFVNEQFEKMGTNKIIIMPSGGAGQMSMITGMMSSVKLKQEDLRAVRAVRGVDEAAELIMRLAKVEFRGESQLTFVSGFPVDKTGKIIEDMQSYEIAEGNELKEGDDNKVVIGYLVANGDLFSRDVSLRNTLTINGHKFRVAGIMKKIGSKSDDASILMTLDAARKIFNEPEDIDMIFAQTKPGYNPSDVADVIKRQLRRIKNEKEGEESFQLRTTEQIMEKADSVLSVINAIFIGIAAISLVVGGIGIMNTMLMSVLERTREIGVMKAIGATNKRILSIFLAEAAFIGMIGGAVGILMGALVSYGVSHAVAVYTGFQMKTVLSPQLLVGALLFSMLVGVISGVYPAMRAAKMEPTTALRYE